MVNSIMNQGSHRLAKSIIGSRWMTKNQSASSMKAIIFISIAVLFNLCQGQVVRYPKGYFRPLMLQKSIISTTTSRPFSSSLPPLLDDLIAEENPLLESLVKLSEENSTTTTTTTTTTTKTPILYPGPERDKDILPPWDDDAGSLPKPSDVDASGPVTLIDRPKIQNNSYEGSTKRPNFIVTKGDEVIVGPGAEQRVDKPPVSYSYPKVIANRIKVFRDLKPPPMNPKLAGAIKAYYNSLSAIMPSQAYK